MTVRAKLLVTIGVIYIVALLGIGVYAIRSANETQGSPARAAQPAETSECTAWSTVRDGVEGPPIYLTKSDAQDAADSLNAKLSASRQTDDPYAPRPTALGIYSVTCGRMSTLLRGAVPARPAVAPRTVYERETITTSLIGSTLALAVAVGGVLIWTPGKKPDKSPTLESAALGPTRTPPRSDIDPTLEPSKAGDSPPPIASQDHVRLAEQLRQLKALHDDGILTDDEYESKRQLLADQL